MSNKKECKVEGCCKKVVANGYCAKHNKQVSLYGRTYRTRYDPNEFVFHKDCVEIRMFGYEYANELHESTYTGSTFIDLDDYDKVKDIKWCLAADGYAFNSFTDFYILNQMRLKIRWLITLIGVN